MTHTLAELAQRFGLELKGEGATVIRGICSMQPGKTGCITFLSNPKFRAQLAGSQASAVIIGKRDAETFTGNGLVAPDPYVAFARIAALFDPYREFPPDVIHPSATVAPGVTVGKGCCIGPNAVIAEGAVLGEGCFIGPNCVIGQNVQLGQDTQLAANVFIWHGVRLGKRCVVQPGAVIGARGFGNAPTPAGWVGVPQLGSVVIGDDVEIGANTTIDRGAIEDTVIENGVKLDNLIQIAHNCHIGAHTAIAACTGIAGSTRIGARCMIGGGVGMNGHIEIADDVIIMGFCMVTKSLTEKGVYGSGLPAEPAREWRKQVAHVRRIEKFERRVKQIEKQLGISQNESGDSGEQNDV
jgi:UDP-3-O-[3-hydroxymyristoyl] glucosamine N-acyltransferase